jgi:hypothetical protein
MGQCGIAIRAGVDARVEWSCGRRCSICWRRIPSPRCSTRRSGDFNWMCDATSTLASYTGVDIVEDLIAGNNARHGDARHRFLCRDLTRDPLPKADLILCRDALVHFSFADIGSALANFRRSESEFLLTTSFIDLARNEDIRTGGWRPLNFQEAPFRSPELLAIIDDIPAGNVAPGKRLCLW